jgi:hypothetical protein
MNLDWLEEYADPYMHTPMGKGVFLSGIVLGFIAKGQAGKGGDPDAAPMFKQITFGKMQRRDLIRHLSRVPELLVAYEDLKKSGFYLRQLSGIAGELLLNGKGDLGVDGNFVFSVAFLNAWDYYWKIFNQKSAENTTKK